LQSEILHNEGENPESLRTRLAAKSRVIHDKDCSNIGRPFPKFGYM